MQWLVLNNTFYDLNYEYSEIDNKRLQSKNQCYNVFLLLSYKKNFISREPKLSSCNHLILESEFISIVAFGLNTLNWKSLIPNGVEGPWDSSNACDFI